MRAPSVRESRQGKDEQQPRFWRSGLLHAGGTVLLYSLVMLLSACSLFPTASQTGNGSGGGTPISSPTQIGTQALTKPPAITLQVSGCPAGLSINWDTLVGTKANVNKVQKVVCGPIEGGAQAALVSVRYYSSDEKLDAYVYDNLSGTPARRFAVQGLAQGDAQISPTNTIMTAQNANNDPLGVNLYKEYQWNGSAFAQVLFPGIFPDVTHYQAEKAQADVNTQIALATATPGVGVNAWQTSAFPVVNRLAQQVFHWPSSVVKDSVVTYNTPSATYIIKATNLGPGGGGFIAKLFRLDGVQTNIFEVQQVTSVDGNLVLASPTGGVQVTSPVKVSGSYSSTGAILGRVVLYNDTYITVGDTGPIHGSAPTGFVSFTPSVNYRLSIPGLQEGVVALYSSNQNNISLSNQVVMVKVFFSA